MKYFLTTIFTTLLLAGVALGDTTSSGATTNTLSNSSGSNTTITGGYSQESTTTYASGSSSNSTTTNTTNSYTGDTRVVPSASAPSISAMSQDLCRVGISVGGQSFGFGISGGTTVIDENCERMKLSKLLYDYNMKVAAVAILCQDDRVFSAMENAGTPCPFEGMIGEDAKAQWKKYDKERPDYEQYTEKLQIRNDIEAGQIILTQEALDEQLQLEKEEAEALQKKLEKSKEEAEAEAKKLQKEIKKIEKENEKKAKEIAKENEKKAKLEAEKLAAEEKQAKLQAEKLAAEEAAKQAQAEADERSKEIFKNGR